MGARAEEVLGYFVRNPQAADTLEGVARWRLLEETVQRNVDETQEAIKWLVAEGFLVEESTRGAQPVFRLNPEMTEQAGRVVSEMAVRRRRDDSRPGMTRNLDRRHDP